MSETEPTKPDPKDQRRTPRIEIKDHFSLRLIIPSISGNKKLKVKDMTDSSIKFMPENQDKIGVGEILETRLYMDTMTYISLKLRVAHKISDGVGCEFVDPPEETVSAIKYFLEYVKIASSHFDVGRYPL